MAKITSIKLYITGRRAKRYPVHFADGGYFVKKLPTHFKETSGVDVESWYQSRRMLFLCLKSAEAFYRVIHHHNRTNITY